MLDTEGTQVGVAGLGEVWKCVDACTTRHYHVSQKHSGFLGEGVLICLLPATTERVNSGCHRINKT